MKRALLPMLLLLAHPAFADTLAIGPHVLVDGDPSGKARQLLGKPDNVVQNENRFGAMLSETWEWYRDGKTIRIEMRDGKIEAISEAR
ncbi:hypothetical protein LVB87_05915 [Lysobacter sp. KIS68-7]|uniref:hypothetical protein n=1 Tax=Lysobacter sp. KIS68-7 TaxID=2904252 RepID=UPI001E4CBC1A|nr:hypothetical protein [Lysobacter sp. KIS68-7]UHQ20678.1 hypothetical protein LVB87_05915 [Lysobacter sp. KIS68-7]